MSDDDLNPSVNPGDGDDYISNKTLITDENPLGIRVNSVDSIGHVEFKDLELNAEQIEKYLLLPGRGGWTINDERKQLEQASFSRSMLLFSLFGAYCITLTLLYVTIPNLTKEGESDLSWILHLPFFVIFLVFGSMLKRTNDKCRIVFQVLASQKYHNYSIVHQLYMRRGNKLPPLQYRFFRLTSSEPFWAQNIVAFFPALFSSIIMLMTLGASR